MARARASKGRRTWKEPSRAEQRRAAATSFQPVLTVVEPLVEGLCRDLPLAIPRGYPEFERSDRAYTLYLAPGWSWCVRTRHRNREEVTFEVVVETAGVEQIEEVSQVADPQAVEHELRDHLTRFLRSASARSLSQEPPDAPGPDS